MELCQESLRTPKIVPGTEPCHLSGRAGVRAMLEMLWLVILLIWILTQSMRNNSTGYRLLF